MYPIETSYPLELIHINFLTIGRVESDKLINILVVTDHFTKYVQAYVTPNQMAKVVAKMLWENFPVHYEWPTKILMDQGRTFESSLVKELCSIAQVRKIRTTPYRPETNGACERFNHTLINMLGTLPKEFKKNWQEWVSTLTHAYNCTASNATGFESYFLMYGQEHQLAIDIEYGVTLSNLTDSNQLNYAKKLEACLKWAFGRAKDYNEKEMNRHKVYYDKRTKCMSLNPDDIVMVRVKAFGSDRKVPINGNKIGVIDFSPKTRLIVGLKLRNIQVLLSVYCYLMPFMYKYRWGEVSISVT